MLIDWSKPRVLTDSALPDPMINLSVQWQICHKNQAANESRTVKQIFLLLRQQCYSRELSWQSRLTHATLHPYCPVSNGGAGAALRANDSDLLRGCLSGGMQDQGSQTQGNSSVTDSVSLHTLVISSTFQGGTFANSLESRNSDVGQGNQDSNNNQKLRNKKTCLRAEVLHGKAICPILKFLT